MSNLPLSHFQKEYSTQTRGGITDKINPVVSRGTQHRVLFIVHHLLMSVWILKGIDLLALAYAVFEFPIPLYWLVLHQGIRSWRRIGYRSFWIALPIWVLCGSALILLRHALFADRFPRSPGTFLLGAALLSIAVWMEQRVHHKFSFKKLAGLPEVNPAHTLKGVVNTGIYSRLRHPRYVHIMLGFIAFALLTGAKGVFLLAIVTILLYLMVAPLEERELRERYGAEYETYARAVPMFIPHLRRKAGKSS